MRKIALIQYQDNTGNTRNCKRGSEKEKSLHTCPYREDIHDDNVTLCDCTVTEVDQCIEDINEDI